MGEILVEHRFYPVEFQPLEFDPNDKIASGESVATESRELRPLIYI